MNELTITYKKGENIGYRQALLDLSVIILKKEYSTIEIIKLIDEIKAAKEKEYKEI